MSSFTSPLSFQSTDRFVGGRESVQIVKGEEYLVLTGARRIVRVLTPFKYADEENGYSYIVPSGFETDLGSIPSVAQGMVASDAPWSQAFVLHDFLYAQLRKSKLAELDRAKADKILNDALKLPFQVNRNEKEQRAVCPGWMRLAIYGAVRIFGRLQ